jgi:hypothetical protein
MPTVISGRIQCTMAPALVLSTAVFPEAGLAGSIASATGKVAIKMEFGTGRMSSTRYRHN